MHSDQKPNSIPINNYHLSSIPIGSHIIIQYNIIVLKCILLILAYSDVLWRTWCRWSHGYRVLFKDQYAIRGKPAREQENPVYGTENVSKNIDVNIFWDVSRGQTFENEPSVLKKYIKSYNVKKNNTQLKYIKRTLIDIKRNGLRYLRHNSVMTLGRCFYVYVNKYFYIGKQSSRSIIFTM